MSSNSYVPSPMRIERISIENDAKDLKTFRLSFCNASDGADFRYVCGQFGMLSIPGTGECPVGIASSTLDAGILEFTVKRYPTGVVTTALHDLTEGDSFGVRGPMGNGFPLKDLKGKNIVIVGGGFAFTTLRSTINYVLSASVRGDYKNITVIYGARSPGELLYKAELAQWQQRSDLSTYVTVDKGDSSWSGRVGLVPNVVKEVAPSSIDTYCIVCGPPIMLKFTLPPLLDLGFTPDKILTSLERKMTCGMGKCGRCNIGRYYVCKDGPVFSYDKIKDIPENGF